MKFKRNIVNQRVNKTVFGHWDGVRCASTLGCGICFFGLYSLLFDLVAISRSDIAWRFVTCFLVPSNAGVFSGMGAAPEILLPIWKWDLCTHTLDKSLSMPPPMGCWFGNPQHHQRILHCCFGGGQSLLAGPSSFLFKSVELFAKILRPHYQEALFVAWSWHWYWYWYWILILYHWHWY